MVSRRLEALQRRLSTTVAPRGRSTGVRRSLSCVVIWYNLANSMTCSSRRSSLVAPTRTGGHRQSHLPPFTRVRRRQKLKDKGVKQILLVVVISALLTSSLLGQQIHSFDVKIGQRIN